MLDNEMKCFVVRRRAQKMFTMRISGMVVHYITQIVCLSVCDLFGIWLTTTKAVCVPFCEHFFLLPTSRSLCYITLLHSSSQTSIESHCNVLAGRKHKDGCLKSCQLEDCHVLQLVTHKKETFQKNMTQHMANLTPICLHCETFARHYLNWLC